MTCEELRGDFEIYALGVDEEPESSEIRAHLRRNCSECVSEMRGSLGLVAQMSSITRTVEPPARLRQRILSMASPALLEQKSRARGFGWSVVWGATAVFLLAVSALLGVQAQRLSNLRRVDNARLEEALALLSAPDSKDVSFGTDRALPPIGRVVVNPRRGVVLIASHLPQLSEGKAFELWLIPKGGKPIASGMFRAGSGGAGLAIQNGQLPKNLGVVAVTIEDAAGANAPTTKPIIAAPVSSAGA